ncbi:hypothetical protein D3C87_1931840 [compost metagenome]
MDVLFVILGADIRKLQQHLPILHHILQQLVDADADGPGVELLARADGLKHFAHFLHHSPLVFLGHHIVDFHILKMLVLDIEHSNADTA